MQTIKHEEGYTSINKIFDDIEKAYVLTSTQRKETLLPILFDNSFITLFEIFRDYGEQTFNIQLNDMSYEKIKLGKYDKKNIILAFSGGKDSIAAALHYKKLGYNVYLYHMRGINKTYVDEWKNAKELADALGLPIYLDDIHLLGSHMYTEHPMKNMLIANGMIKYGIENNIGVKIAFGNYYTSHIEDTKFDVCSGDSQDMWRAYEEIVSRVLPRFRVLVPLQNINTSLKAMVKHPELLPLCKSCVGSYRYRKWLHETNEHKYGIELLPDRCGSCWKCAEEYIYMTDHNVLQYNRKYYQHCLDVLVKDAKLENRAVANYEELWGNYLQYDIRKSRYFQGE